MRIAFLAVVLTAQLVPNGALAQTAAERAACQADFEKLCEGVKPGGGRVLQCLAEHVSELTPGCRKVVKAHTPG